MGLVVETSTPLWEQSLIAMNSHNGSDHMGHDQSIPSSSSFGGEGWTNLSPYNQSPYTDSPMQDYGFQNYVTTPLPSESLARMPPPSQQTQFHHPLIQPPSHSLSQPPLLPPPPAPGPSQSHQAPMHMGHHQLPMLDTSSTHTQWPSQLTNPSPSAGSYSAPVANVTPLSGGPPAEPPRLTPQSEKREGRRTLTKEVRQKICEFAEQNPGMKQELIGEQFGVERSTVSKVIKRQDHKKSNIEADKTPAKRSKTALSSVERAVESWARKQPGHGSDLTDAQLKDQAEKFALINPDKEVVIAAIDNSKWVQKFRKEYKLSRNGDSKLPQLPRASKKLARRASETNIDKSRNTKPRTSSMGRTSGMTSPLSGSERTSPVSQENKDEEMGEASKPFTYKQEATQSSTSLTSDIRETQSTTISPVTHFNFSPDPNAGAFQPIDTNLTMHHGGPSFVQREKRSNTFPSLGLEFMSQGVRSEPITPQLPAASTTVVAPEPVVKKELKPLLPAGGNVSTLPTGLDPNLSGSPTLRRKGSTPNLARQASTPAGGGLGSSLDASPIATSPEEARRSANTLYTYIHENKDGIFDQKDYNMIAQLTQKLLLHQQSGPRSGWGSLSRIPEGDGEGVLSPEIFMKTT